MKIACVAVFCLFAIWHANGQGDQCETDNGGCEQTCMTVLDAGTGTLVPECSCTTGYSLNENGKNCDSAGSGSAAGSASSSGEGSAGSGSAAGSASSSGEGSAPAPPTFGLCNNPIPNRGKAKGRCPWKYPMLQRYSHSKQGDVCLTDPDLKPPGPELKKWKCPRGCKKVKRPPFCENEEGDACRVPLPGGGPSEETSVEAPCCTNWEGPCYDVSNANNNNLACNQFDPNICYAVCGSDASSSSCHHCCTSSAPAVAPAAAAWNCPATCNMNSAEDMGETGIDCGGGGCPDCVCNNNGVMDDGEMEIDCGKQGCPECDCNHDNEQNNGETGIDCGVAGCPECESKE